MKESPFDIEYSWQDIKPIRALFVTALVAQVVGAGICLWVAPLASWFDNLWMGGALSTFPGYLAGLPIQMRVRPGRIGENKVMIRRMGYVAFALTLAAIVFLRIGSIAL